jgi:hypothetical protein
LIAVLAVIGGAIAGFALTLAIVVARARAGSYIFGLEELAEMRLETLPIALAALAGAVLGIRDPTAVDRAAVWGFAACFAGALIGIPMGRLMWGAGEGPWAGAIVFGAIGFAGGGVASFRSRRQRTANVWAGAPGTIALLLVAAFGAFGATRMITLKPLDLPAFEGVPVPDPADVDAVVFLLGDAGATVRGGSPLIDAIRTDIERWSASLARDSAVSIVFLGDLVYPAGVRSRSHPAFETDSVRLWNQIELVGGREATAHSSVGLFLTGNHDWGNASGDAGMERVLNLAEQLMQGRRAGRAVSLLPPAGEPGPVMRDLRENVRLVFVDTHWFLQTRSSQEREEFFERMDDALDGAGGREVIIVAHHPYSTAGPHGEFVPGYHTGGIEFLLKRSGTLVQDLNSPVYTGFLERMRQIFESRDKRPLVFAGGHDHSLQVLTGAGDFDPRFVLVSGAGSKVSSIRNTDGLVWGASEPGWMMVVFRKDDGVDLFVVAGDRRYLTCTGTKDAVAQCMAAGVNAFEVVYSTALLGPSKRPAGVEPVTPGETGALSVLEPRLRPAGLKSPDTHRPARVTWQFVPDAGFACTGLAVLSRCEPPGPDPVAGLSGWSR